MIMQNLTFKKEDVKAHFQGRWRDFYSHYLNFQNGKGNGYKAVCLFHDDSDPSLSIDNDEGLWHCFGCKTGGDAFEFYAKLKGLDVKTDFPGILQGIADDFGISGSPGGSGKTTARKKKDSVKRKIVATYFYTDEEKKILYKKDRIEPGYNGKKKSFVFSRLDEQKGWVNAPGCMEGVRRVLYHLYGITKRLKHAIFFCEGEKDSDRLTADFKALTTTVDGGAGTWRSEYNEFLRDREIVILPDNDEPGRKHAEQIAKSLYGVSKSIRIIEFPGLSPKGDVSDWIDAGGTKEALQKLVDDCPLWKPEEDPSEAIKKQFPRGPFPWLVFPSRIAESLQQLARSCATSPTSLPGAAMAIFASTIGCRVDVSPKLSWKEPLILWLVDVRPSGAGKTPAARALCQVLYEAQDKADKDYQAEYDEWRALPKKERDARNEPARPRGYFTTSLTIEGLHADHSGHGGKVCILDELSSFISAQNQYKSKGNDREAWLCLYDGKTARIVRVKESKTIRGARISIFGGIQPAIWISSFSGDEGQIYRVDGTIYRFLPTYEGTGFHPLTLEAWSEENKDEWEETLRTAMRWSDNQDENKTLYLNSDAQEIFLDWRNGLCRRRFEFVLV